MNLGKEQIVALADLDFCLRFHAPMRPDQAERVLRLVEDLLHTEQWPPADFDPQSPDWVGIPRAAVEAKCSEITVRRSIKKANREGQPIAHYFCGKWYVSLKRFLRRDQS